MADLAVVLLGFDFLAYSFRMNGQKLAKVGGAEVSPQTENVLINPKKVSIHSTPTLDTKTVPTATKLPDSSLPLSSPNL
jgi:hypothetical protein